ncbi:MAG: acetate--CoA ligase family protein, partial [Allobranchiibius sp.]
IDHEALELLVARVSMIAEHLPEAASLELNPVNTHEAGLEVLGARIVLAPSPLRTDRGRRALS